MTETICNNGIKDAAAITFHTVAAAPPTASCLSSVVPTGACQPDHWCTTLAVSFFFVFNIYLFIYLFGCTGSQLWHTGSLVATCMLLVAACRT